MLTYEQKLEAVIKYLRASDNSFAKYMNELERQKEAPVDLTTDKIDRVIRNTLIDYDIKPSIAGFRTLMIALRLIYSDPTYLKHLHNRLYPEVAKIIDGNPRSVGKSIAYAGRKHGTPKTFLASMYIKIDNTIKLVGG